MVEISATVEQKSGGIIGIYRGYWDGVNPFFLISWFLEANPRWD